MLGCELNRSHKIEVISIYKPDKPLTDPIPWSKKIGDFLVSNSNLIDLQLRNECETTYEDLQNIFNALKHNTTLQVLRIIDDKLPRGIQFSGSHACQHYAEGLADNTSLTHLELTNVKLRGGIRTLAEALQQNKALKILYFNDHTINEQDIDALTSSLKFNTTLEVLHLSPFLEKDLISPLMKIVEGNRAAKGSQPRSLPPTPSPTKSPRARPVSMHLNTLSISNPDFRNLNPAPKKAPTSPQMRQISSPNIKIPVILGMVQPGPLKQPGSPKQPGSVKQPNPMVARFETRVDELLQYNEALQISYQSSVQECDELRAENIELRREKEQFQSQLVTYMMNEADANQRDVIDSLEIQVQELASANEALSHEIETLQQQKLMDEKDLQDTLQQVSSHAEALQREIDELKKQRKFQIEFSDIEFGRKIGEGGYGEVFAATWYGEKFAVKKLKQEHRDPQLLANFKQEAQTMTRLHHKHIVLCMGTAIDPRDGDVMLVMEFMKHGSLEDLLFKRQERLSRAQALRLALDVAKGVHYLHCLTPRIIHRDLKCANILLYNNKKRAKISDFGAARPLNMNSNAHTIVGTLGYTAPEILGNKAYNEKSDVFSFGAVLYAMMTGKQLAIVEESERMEKIGAVSDVQIRQLIMACCRTNPENRTTIRVCIEELQQMRQNDW